MVDREVNLLKGDAIALFRFTHTLSQYYQNKVSEFPTPTFRKHVFQPPSEAIAAEYHTRIRQLQDPYPFAELGAVYAEAGKGIENFQWRCSGEELRRLHAKICSSGPPTLTIQDCLTAYLVTVLNRCQERPIRMVTNAASVSGGHNPVWMVLLIPIQVSKCDSAIRRSERGRKCDPKCLYSSSYGDDELLKPY